MRKIILTDVDGVLLDWIGAFDEWMHEEHGQLVQAGQQDAWDIALRFGAHQMDSARTVKQFNESAVIGFLNPLLDSVKYVRRLHEEHGFTFRAITSVGNNRYTRILREQNLIRLYGEVFDDIICLPMKDNKRETLSKYKNTGHYWIEDHVGHAEIGAELGLNSIVVERIYNTKDLINCRLPRAKNWREIYSLITGE